jgi:cytochrome b
MTDSTTPGAAHAAPTRRRLVTDAPTRTFHWLFALSFAGAWATADGERWRALHETLGYTMAGLLAFRLAYGLLGPRHARIAPLLRRLARAPAWLRSTLASARGATPAGVAWHEGRNAAMALAIVALLALVVPLTLSGYGIDAVGSDWMEGAHEFIADAFLVVVLSHLALIVGVSLLQRRNQAVVMLTGRVDGAGPDLVRDNRAWLAALLVACALVFAGWQWRQSPHGLVPTLAAVEGDPATGRDRDADD